MLDGGPGDAVFYGERTRGDAATDLMLMFGSSAMYLTLRRYGWSEEAFVAWSTDTLTEQLLPRP